MTQSKALNLQDLENEGPNRTPKICFRTTWKIIQFVQSRNSWHEIMRY